MLENERTRKLMEEAEKEKYRRVAEDEKHKKDV